MRNGTFCTTTIVRKMHGNRLCMHTRSLPVTWLSVMPFPVRAASGDVNSVSSSSNGTLAVPIYYLPKTLRFEWNSYSTRRMYIWANYSVSSYLNLIPIRVFCMKCVNLIEIRFDAYIYAPYFLVLWHIIFEITAQIPEVEFGGKYGYLRANVDMFEFIPVNISTPTSSYY
jgi:hypothetical protein